MKMNYQGIRFLIWQLRSIGRSVKSHGTLCFIVILQYYIGEIIQLKYNDLLTTMIN